MSVSETAEVVTNRSKGIASTSNADAAAAAIETTRGRGAPRSTQASTRIRNSGRDDEHVALLDAIGEARCEDPDHDRQPDEQRQRDGEQHLERTVERPRPHGEHDGHGERDHSEVEIELGDVVDDEVQHTGDVVARLARRRRTHRAGR